MHDVATAFSAAIGPGFRHRDHGTMNPVPSARPTPPELLQQARTIAVVGFSTDPTKAAHRAPMVLVDRGWNVIPVHPTATEVAGLTAYKTLADIPVPVDLVDVFRPPSEAPGIAEQAAAIGAKTLWLQKGITSPEARDIATRAGMTFVEDTCAGATATTLNLFPNP
ncbi:MAG: CoA-binding protein [Thermoleophilia bacterium]|nr:CoA-binding protein [Thermoleophilia bacterium]